MESARRSGPEKFSSFLFLFHFGLGDTTEELCSQMIEHWSSNGYAGRLQSGSSPAESTGYSDLRFGGIRREWDGWTGKPSQHDAGESPVYTERRPDWIKIISR